MADELNTEILKRTFEEAQFPVKVAEKDGKGIFRFEYNFPDDRAAVAMRVAFLRKGAEVSTIYQYQSAGSTAGELLSRERALVPFDTDATLRKFFNDVIDEYMRIADERSMTTKKESSYVKETRKRRALYR